MNIALLTESSLVICLLIAYLIGSIPFGFLLAKLAGISDIRVSGSGNIGATNVMRVAGKKLGVFTLLLDIGKGIVAIYVASRFTSHELIVACAAVTGHVFPVWLKFKGGKGVASALGVLLFCSPKIGLAAILFWIITFAVTRISSLSAIMSFALTPLFTYLFVSKQDLFIFSLFLSILVIIRHYSNIIRLLQGREKRLDNARN
jgi:glycerol-3-phosphate acyltransferase PlsY